MMNINYRIFNSSNELADYIIETPAKWTRAEALNPKAEKLLRFGDKTNVEALKCELKTFGAKKVIKYDFCGKTPVVPKALMSDPYCFMNIVKRRRPENKYITIIYDQSVSCSYPAEQIIENGKKLLSTLKFLEQNGYRIRLFGCVSGYCDEINMLLLKLKDYQEGFSLNRIAFPIANPLFLRNVSFAWEDRDPVTVFQTGYGRPISRLYSDNTLGLQLSHFLGKGCVYVTEPMVASENFLEKLLKESELLVKKGFEN